MRRGSILQYLVGSQRLRVVVLTADRYNPDYGLLAPLRERGAPPILPAFIVPLTKRDWPAAAVIDLSRARSIDPTAITGTAGQLSPATLSNLTLAVRTYLGVAN